MSLTKLCGIVVVVSTLVFAPNAIGQVALRPVDEAASQPDFFTFRAHLQTAIARRDASAVLTIVYKEIKNSFGGDDGFATFKQKWKLESGKSDFWKELGAVLALGGSFDRDEHFIAPYVFSRWPDKMDSFENVAIIGANVRVREAPRDNSATAGSLSFVIVPLLREQEAHKGWTAIRQSNGKAGYVLSQYARSPIAYRAIFKRIDNRWQLTSFLAGD